MIINGKTPIFINGKQTRVCGRTFNEAMRGTASFSITDQDGRHIIPSSNLPWHAVAKLIRTGKKVQARVS